VETATFVVNRNINFNDVCVVGLRLFAGSDKASARRNAYLVAEEDFAARVEEAIEFGATRSACRAGSIPDYTLEELRGLAAAGEGGRPGDPPARLLADGGPLHV